MISKILRIINVQNGHLLLNNILSKNKNNFIFNGK